MFSNSSHESNGNNRNKSSTFVSKFHFDYAELFETIGKINLDQVSKFSLTKGAGPEYHLV